MIFFARIAGENSPTLFFLLNAFFSVICEVMRPKLFRDPVHDIIKFDQSNEVEKVLLDIVDTDAFQRLRRIRQLGFANLVYHGAEHSRFSHSVGVLHIARRMCETLKLEDDERLEVLLAAALHDIGHGPFSHAIERVTGVDHETYSKRMVLEHAPIRKILEKVDANLPDRIAKYFGPLSEFPADKLVLRDIVSSQLDADRLDYILRDGLATGVKIGVFDFERIQTMFQIQKVGKGRRLAVNFRAKEAVEGYLIARFHMFKQVYLHKTVRSAEKMLEALFQRVSFLVRDGYQFQSILSDQIKSLLSKKGLDAEKFSRMDDSDLWVAIKSWTVEDDATLALLSNGLLSRKLFKTFELNASDAVGIARIVDRTRDIARAKGFEPDYTVLVDRAQDTPYRPYDSSSLHAKHIPIIDHKGHARPIEEVSDLVHLLGRDAYKITRLCVPFALRDEVKMMLRSMHATKGL